MLDELQGLQPYVNFNEIVQQQLGAIGLNAQLVPSLRRSDTQTSPTVSTTSTSAASTQRWPIS
jgi:hypothetical protein